MKVDLRKIYRFEPVVHEAGAALPTGGNVFYECVECGFVVSSVPYTPAECECGNLKGNKGEITVADAEKVKLVKGVLK